jgi:hypothetical protein
MIVAVVRFALPAAMSVEEARTVFAASAPGYQNVPGLNRKHYLLGSDGTTAGGIYLWASRGEAEAFYDAAWRERVTQRYGTPPVVEYFVSPVSVDPVGIVVS